MRKILASVLGLAALIALSSVTALSQTKLDVVVEGPFFICENADQHFLLVSIPALDDTHFVPAFKSLRSEIALGVPDEETVVAYPNVKAPLVYEMAFKSPTATTGIDDSIIKQKGQQDTIVLARRGGAGFACAPNANGASVMVKLPIPKSIYLIERASEPSCISPAGKNCVPNTLRRYATGVTLRYEGLTTQPVLSGPDPAHPGQAVGAGFEFDTSDPDRLEVHLDVIPLPNWDEDDAHCDSMNAFDSMSKLSDRERNLHFPKMCLNGPARVTMMRVSRTQRGRKAFPFSVVKRTDCQAPTMLICKNCTLTIAGEQ
ncbi:hypothetical protein Acid345_4246 [Candidatus Koribacter versatilis Ellin345]|uniref:Secreted protein n=1 Tax=Koribacter versatilis (strain Ellin345) TaxID=204669 RepID=Q1IIQ4_KORVE|nr:hypothetical protein [Candidatus Koribacter versatilis]ABF43246.1 hypothetical protein Acid345_4246 [Candidatus Koribacter versatilis Ellin345]